MEERANAPLRARGPEEQRPERDAVEYSPPIDRHHCLGPAVARADLERFHRASRGSPRFSRNHENPGCLDVTELRHVPGDVADQCSHELVEVRTVPRHHRDPTGKGWERSANCRTMVPAPK